VLNESEKAALQNIHFALFLESPERKAILEEHSPALKRKQRKHQYGKFIIYEPHAKIIKWLFVRFIELGYDLVAFKRELQQKPRIFPAFESFVHPADISRCNLREQNGGYSFCETTLERILTNEVYIGTYKREGATRLKNHPAIVDEELFWSVYDHIKDFRPDGTPTHRIRLVRYSQRVNYSDREPLISFTSSRPNVSISFGKNRTWYHYKARSYNGMTRETLLSADADTVESAIVKKLFAKLQYVDIGDLEQKRKAMLAEKANRVKKLERDSDFFAARQSASRPGAMSRPWRLTARTTSP